MRCGTLLCCTLLLVGCQPASQAKADPPASSTAVAAAPFDGVWSPVSVKYDSAEQMDAKSRQVIVLSVEKGEYKMYLLDDPVKLTGRRLSTAAVTLDATAGTFELDIRDGEKKGTKMHGIFTATDGELTLAYAPSTQPRPTKYEATGGVFVETWTKYKKK